MLVSLLKSDLQLNHSIGRPGVVCTALEIIVIRVIGVCDLRPTPLSVLHSLNSLTVITLCHGKRDYLLIIFIFYVQDAHKF